MIDLLSKNIKIWTSSGLIGLFVLAMTIGSSGAASASAGSQFTQKIKPTYCGQLPDCQMQPTTITSVSSQNRKFMVTGKYDRLNSQSLRVFFHGSWYTLGVDSQLTVSGDDWFLDLEDASFLPLPPGDYSVEVQTVTLIGNTLSYTAHLRVNSPPDDPEEPGQPDKPDDTSSVTILPPSTGYSGHEKLHQRSLVQSFFDSLVVSCVICVLGIGSLVLAWRLNKR